MILDAPQPEPGRWQAAVFTIVVHMALLAFLIVGVQWKHKPQPVVEVELWSGRPGKSVSPEAPIVPPVLEPKPEPKPEAKPELKPEPKPQPKPEVTPPRPQVQPEAVKKPDIAIRQDKKVKPGPAKPHTEPLPRPDRPKQEALPDRPPRPIWESALRNEEMARGIEQDRAQLAVGAAAAARQRAQVSWMDRIRGKIRGNTVQPPNLRGNPVAVFNVNLSVTGDILSVGLKRSSGVRAWDEATERAIHKSSPLPKPEDASVFERELELKLCPDEEQGCR